MLDRTAANKVVLRGELTRPRGPLLRGVARVPRAATPDETRVDRGNQVWPDCAAAPLAGHGGKLAQRPAVDSPDWSDLPAAPSPDVRLLVVIPDDTSRLACASLLERAGYDVTAVPDADAALADTALSTPDLVVMQLPDSQPPDLRLCRQLRTGVTTRHVPVLVLTARSDTSFRELVVRMGGSAILSEPTKRPHLLRQVRRLLARTRSHPSRL